MEKQQTSPKPYAKGVCEECKKQPSKYTCPGCSLRSCSLPCVKAHKHRSGLRTNTLFVPLSRFNDDLLLSEVAESAQRARGQLPADSRYNFRALRNAAGSRRTRLLLLPPGMSKRLMNQTRYNPREKFISWTIEWRFHMTDVVLHDHGVHEDTNLCSVIEKHLKPGPWNHQLKQFCDEPLDSLKLFIIKYPKGPKSPFCELDIKGPLRQQLANVTILEYPVIHVFLPSHSPNFEVVKILSKSEVKSSVTEKVVPKGVTFKEEEIEDDNSPSETQVYDIKQESLSHLHEATRCETSGKTLEGSTDGTVPVKLEVDENVGNSSESSRTIIFEDMEFDFDQGLMDVYSDLMGEVNPDDFLNFEGEFKVQEAKGFCDSRGMNLVQEELEEGEIWE